LVVVGVGVAGAIVDVGGLVVLVMVAIAARGSSLFVISNGRRRGCRRGRVVVVGIGCDSSRGLFAYGSYVAFASGGRRVDRWKWG
jgi:hypothetical protein